MNNLIKKAKQKPKNRTVYNIEVTDDVYELVIEMLNGNVSYRQGAYAIGMEHPGNMSHFIPTILRKGCQEGKLKIKLVK